MIEEIHVCLHVFFKRKLVFLLKTFEKCKRTSFLLSCPLHIPLFSEIHLVYVGSQRVECRRHKYYYLAFNLMLFVVYPQIVLLPPSSQQDVKTSIPSHGVGGAVGRGYLGWPGAGSSVNISRVTPHQHSHMGSGREPGV